MTLEVVESSDRQLVLRDRPILVVLALLAGAAACLYAVLAPEADQTATISVFLALLALAMLGAAWWFAPWQRIVFDRASGMMEHHVHRLGRASLHRLPLGAIRKIRHDSDLNDNSRTYRLVLETEDGIWPLTSIYTGGRHDETEEAIRDWLTRPIGDRQA
ncbi:MAG: hypothetical protein AAF577_04830 [Pseudomonadota bacterium]